MFRAGFQRFFSTARCVRSAKPRFNVTAEDIAEARRLRSLKDANKRRKDTTSITLYASGLLILAGTLSYASVPLYRAICSRTGFGGTPITDSTKFTPEKMTPIQTDKRIKIKFSSEVSSQMPWKFKPEQQEVSVLPGETALAFYKAKNTSPEPIVGMATYTVIPERAAAYFSKIQCFCFEEQLLMPGEEVDMPLFFFIDPDFALDPAMAHISDIVLHYTFFKAQYKDRAEEKRIVGELTEQFKPSPQ